MNQLEQTEYFVVAIVVMEDGIIHDDEHPFCDDPECPCWEEADRRAEEYERRYIESGMTERYDSLPWRYGNSLS
jgi:hypothetical protein